MATALFPGQAPMPAVPKYGTGVPSILRRPTMPQAGAGGVPTLLAPQQATPPSVLTGGVAAAPAATFQTNAQSNPDPILEAIRALTSGQSASRAAGARLTALNASPNDPSLAAYGSLMGELGGQDQAAQMRGEASLDWNKTLHDQAWQEQMMRLKAKLDRANRPNPLAQLGGNLAGKVLGPVANDAGEWISGKIFG